jgi:SMC interacting uncharacterized protein involved in chromosome segregation
MARLHPDYPNDFTTKYFTNDLLAMTETALLNKHEQDVYVLLNTGRMTVDLGLFRTAQELVQMADLLTERLRYNFSERDQIRRNLDQMRREKNDFWLRLTEARREIDRINAERDTLVRERGILQGHLGRIRGERDRTNHANNILVRERNEARIRYTGTLAQYNLVFGQLGQANAQIGHTNNRVQFGIRTLARLRNRFMQQIAALRIQVQWFRIRQLNLPPPPLNNPSQTTWLLLQ